MVQYRITADTDIGIRKRTNQDSVILRLAETNYGKALLAAVCDGMGGLEKGEVASAAMVTELDIWFKQRLPAVLSGGVTNELLRQELTGLVGQCSKKIMEYGKKNQVRMGTTVSLLFILGLNYYIVHVGDSRIYEITKKMVQLTHDQTVVANEVSQGLITEAQARSDPRRNILVQCVGASESVQPEFQIGVIRNEAVYLLCTDGFRHEITEKEILGRLEPLAVVTEEDMKEQARYLIELNKQRQETDNISVILIRTYEGV